MKLDFAIAAAIHRSGATPARSLLAELRQSNASLTPEAMYERLVSLEAKGILRVEPTCENGQRGESVWAFGSVPMPSELPSRVHLCR